MRGFCRLLLLQLVAVGPLASSTAVRAAETRDVAHSLIRQFCVDCHQSDGAEAGVNLQELASADDVGSRFRVWRKVIEQVEQELMPPESAEAQPTAEQRRRLVALLRQKLQVAAKEHDGEPGAVVLRRLTSAEYGYAIHDLTGIDFETDTGFVSDAVGGAGFTNTGIVQFTQDSTLERYLEAARQVADHAVVGTGPLGFFQDAGQTGFELSAIDRILRIYRRHGFRSAAGEGGKAFGLEKYPQAFLVAWRYRHRKRLGNPEATLESLALDAGMDIRFAEYIHSVLSRQSATFPTSEITEAWQRLPEPTTGSKEEHERVRQACQQLAELLSRWQNRFGANVDAKEEAPVLRADLFEVKSTQPFEMNVNWPQGTRTAHLVITVESANGVGSPDAVIRWETPQVQFRNYARRLADPQPLRESLSDQTIARLGFGRRLRGDQLASTDFATEGTGPIEFELPVPDGARSARLLVTARLDVERGEDCIVRCSIAQLEETDQGKSVSGLLADPQSPAFQAWKDGVLEFARLLPQMSQREPAPSDRDPVPAPIDNSYNNPERNFFHTRIKYFRDDQFLVDNVLDEATRQKLDQAWADLKGSFEFHDTWLQVLADKYGLELGGRRMADVDEAWIAGLPSDAQVYVRQQKADFERTRAMFAGAESGHLDDALGFAARAWRRPLKETEQRQLRTFYKALRANGGLDHRAAVCAVIARILVSPEFLYRTERMGSRTGVEGRQDVALSSWELASRLSFLLWSSVPDDELRRAAAAGELSDPPQLQKQVRRMLRDRRSRRFATEFFGQWFGFYRFHLYGGVDEEQFPEFSPALRQAMYDEAVEFFDSIVRERRPVDDILFADDTFVNSELAKHYGFEVPEEASQELHRVAHADRFQRGGLLKLGAVLVTTSAPRRTSPVKRGDWILRRVLGTAVPPPPADAGSITAEEVSDDGASIRQRLIAHRRDVSCHNCHARFDALGFALENYDALGRWRTHYGPQTPVETSGTLRDGHEIAGVDGLHEYLFAELPRFHETLATKLVGYALGRQAAIGDQSLIEAMMKSMQNGGDAAGLIEQIVVSRQFRYRQVTEDNESIRSVSESTDE